MTPVPPTSLTPESTPERRRRRRAAASRTDIELGREADHRIKNSLQLVAGMLSREARNSQDPQLSRHLGEAVMRIQAVARLHDHLSTSKDGEIEVLAFLRSVCEDLAVAGGCADRGIEIKVDGSPMVLPASPALMIGLIVTELATNAIKHAYAQRGGVVRVQVRSHNGSGGCEVTVADDGPGLAAALDVSDPGSGLGFARQLANGLEGELVFEGRRAGKGVVARLSAPACRGQK
jgi:two-component sensor histidine kinase